MANATSGREQPQASFLGRSQLYPDLSFIKKYVPVSDVARELGLRVFGKSAHCWRTESHKHGDRIPSIGFNTKKNIAKCFVCNDHAWSNVDLVQQVLDCSTREAIDWIAARYYVPQIPKGKHLSKREQWHPSYRAGATAFSLEAVVRCGYWAMLAPSEKSVLAVFCTFAEPSTGATKISYRGIMRFAGIGSCSSVAKALKRFQKNGLLEIDRHSDGDGFRSCNTYSFTLEDPKFQRTLRETYQRQKSDIDIERQIRTEQKQNRRAARAAYTGKSSLQPV